MSTRAGRALALLAATAVVVSPAAPVHAEEPVVADLPVALDADPSPSETTALADLTDGGGSTRLSAFVETAEGAEVVTFEAPSATAAEDAVSADAGTSAISGYVVRAYQGGTLARSVAAGNAVGAGPASAAGRVVPRTTPGAPGVRRADAVRSGAVVRWQAPARRAARSLTVGGLAPGRAYVFRVLARNVAGTGAGSSFSNAVVPLR